MVNLSVVWDTSDIHARRLGRWLYFRLQVTEYGTMTDMYYFLF
jgi:hypothetical protein